MQKDSKSYQQLLRHIKKLFTRDYLCSSTYMFRHLQKDLSLPLQIILKEKGVQRLTKNVNLVRQAIQESGLAKIGNGSILDIIQFPTYKLSTKDQHLFREIEKILKDENKKYVFSERGQRNFINLTLLEQDESFFEDMMVLLDKNIDFQKVELYEDMKNGTAKIQQYKIKFSNSVYVPGVTKYSQNRTPQTFVRKAVDSDDEEDWVPSKQIVYENGKPTKVKLKRDRTGKHSKNRNKVPIINGEDFPQLS